MSRSETDANEAMSASCVRQQHQARIAHRVSLDARPRVHRRVIQWVGTFLLGLLMSIPMLVDAIFH